LADFFIEVMKQSFLPRLKMRFYRKPPLSTMQIVGAMKTASTSENESSSARFCSAHTPSAAPADS
jgi:hypothetical protein